LKFCCFAVWV